MKLLQKQIGRYPTGIWVALIALLLTSLAWMMQLYSLINWDGAVELGLQNESFSGDSVERALANVERGIALADLCWALPITIIAFIGVLKRRLYGLIASMMDFAICVYFPLFFAFQRWNTHLDVVLAAIFLFAVPSILGIIGLGSNMKMFKA